MDRRDFLKTAGQATAVIGLAGGWTSLASKPSFAENGSPESSLSLGGTWGFHLDPENVGREFTSWPEVDFSNAMVLPGSTDEAGYGTKTTGPEFGHLTREWRYEGAAWYQREIEIPGPVGEPVQLDGDDAGRLPVRIRLVENAVAFVRPVEGE